jgi:exopolyphosphatase/guanosine-5'-triphosphate,3'-diphosphate pyrophosphatase
MPLRIAALDVGSLTVRLAVAEETGSGQFRVIRHRREVTALGEGLARTGVLSESAMARTLKALQEFVAELRDLEVGRWQAVATEALRQAANRQVLVERLQELGITVRLLTPAEEARLTLKGVLSALRREFLAAPAVVVFDVGGGSSEFTLLRPGQAPFFAGLPLGVLSAISAQPLGDPPRPEAVSALRQALAQELTTFYRENFQAPLGSEPGPRLVGTAGAATTLAALVLKMSNYDPDRVNNMIITRGQVEGLAGRLARLPEAERARLPGMEAAKAGVMVAGALIILTILDVFRQDSLVVIDAGLLEGVLEEAAKYEGGPGNAVPCPPPNPLPTL